MSRSESAGPAGRSWQVRPFAPGDEAAVTRLYEAVHGQPMDPAYYRWKFLAAPGSLPEVAIWLADTGPGLAGHYGATWLRFWLDGREHLILQCANAMTAADFRRQGALSALGEVAHRACAAAGVAFIMGLPNEQWGTRLAYLGYRPQYEMGWLRRILRPEQRLPARLRPALAPLSRAWNAAWNAPLRRLGRGIAVTAAAGPGLELDTLWADLRPQYEAVSVRDRAWLQYRYFSAPGVVYRLLLAWRGNRPAGYLVYRLTEQAGSRAGWIVDLFTGPDDAAVAAALLERSLVEIAQAGAAGARFLVATRTPLAGLLRRGGFFSAPGRFVLSAAPLALDPLPAALGDPRRWYSTAGDYDII